jgi:DNA-binding transcriptional ArsR family regulator
MDIVGIDTRATAAVVLLKAIANESRLIILSVLNNQGEKSVGELEQIVGLSQSALSQHLARLRKDGLVQTRREAQTIFYSLGHDSVKDVLSCLKNLFCAEKI